MTDKQQRGGEKKEEGGEMRKGGRERGGRRGAVSVG